MANLLLDRGADINAHGNFHITALVWAAGRGHTKLACSLIARGAKVNVGDKVYIKYKNIKSLKTLYKNCNIMFKYCSMELLH